MCSLPTLGFITDVSVSAARGFHYQVTRTLFAPKNQIHVVTEFKGWPNLWFQLIFDKPDLVTSRCELSRMTF